MLWQRFRMHYSQAQHAGDFFSKLVYRAVTCFLCPHVYSVFNCPTLHSQKRLNFVITAHVCQGAFYWTYFHKVWHCGLAWIFVEKIQLSLNVDKSATCNIRRKDPAEWHCSDYIHFLYQSVNWGYSNYQRCGLNFFTYWRAIADNICTELVSCIRTESWYIFHVMYKRPFIHGSIGNAVLWCP